MDAVARALADELMRRIMERIDERIGAYLARIAPELLSGRIPASALPPGTMIDRGDYSGASRYRPGDVVVSGGVVSVAILASTATAPPNATYWRPLGGAVTTELLFWNGEGLSWNGEALYWG